MIGTMDHPLIGRDQDLATLETFLGSPGPTVLVLEGEAGIGKTTLLDAALESARASGTTVLRARPTEAESLLSFVGLNDLVENVEDDAFSDLCEPQQLALESALGRTQTESPVESGVVAMAFLAIVRWLADNHPLLIAIDDYHWLDKPSRRVVEYALRRLSTETVKVIVTSRLESPIEWERSIGSDRVTRHTIESLASTAIYHLVYDRFGVPLGRPTLLTVHETSRGNPLFAIELARALIDHREDDYQGRPLPLPVRLIDLLQSRIGRQPPRTGRLLAAASAMSRASVEDLSQLVEEPETKVVADLEPAERAGIVATRDGVVEFSHPLLAAAAYSTASPSQRASIHTHLAGIVAQPEEASRHLALARRAPDGHAASMLAAAGERAASRGATDVGAFFAEQSLRLTPVDDRAARFHRTVAAARLVLATGNQSRARELFDRALNLAEPGDQRAITLLERAKLATPLGQGVAFGIKALSETRDPSVRSSIHSLLGAISYVLGDVAEAERHAQAAVALGTQGADPEVLGLALAELAHWTFCGGGGYREDLFERAVSLNQSAGASSPRSHYAKITLDAGHFDKARSQLDRLLAEASAKGDLQGVAAHRLHLGQLEMWTGEFARAIEHADESLLLHEYSDQPSAPRHVKAMSLACTGRIDQARHEAEVGLIEAEKSQNVLLAIYNLAVLGFIELSLGDPAAAHERLSKAIELHRPRWNREFGDVHLVPDAIEALVALGDLDRAEDLLEWMEQTGTATGRTWVLAAGLRCRGICLAASGRMTDAEEALESAIQYHERLQMPFELARTLLILGSVQRRMKKRAMAVDTLRRAYDMFTAIDAGLWAAKAQSEIDRIGVRTRAQGTLTPIEGQIATLASEGYNNRQIADLLFISRKTVEANLTHVYRKLGIHSRAQLGTVLAGIGRSAPAE
jgi:DNA-binding CsgD family transcriptional regulator